MKRITGTLLLIILFVIILTCIGIYQSFTLNTEEIDSSFILTVISSVAALGGITVAIYGFFLTFQLPRLIEDKVNKKLQEYDSIQVKREEATQKMMAVYGIKDPDQKIELLHDIIQLNPKTYNVYVTLAYTYWYDKKDVDAALEYFHKDLEHHPDNYQSMCDLIALHTELEEWNSAIHWFKKAYRINPKILDDIEHDSRLSPLRQSIQYQKVIKSLKSV